MKRQYRTVESVKKRLDLMLKQGSEILLYHGSGAYRFSRYEHCKPCPESNWKESLYVYYIDGVTHKESEYMVITDDVLRKPTEDDFGLWFVDCHWEKEYPSLIYMREYTLRR